MHRAIKDDEITEILNKSVGGDVESATNKLLDEIKKRQPSDDVSILQVKVVSEVPVATAGQNRTVMIALAAAIVTVLVIAGIMLLRKNSAAEKASSAEPDSPSLNAGYSSPNDREDGVKRGKRESCRACNGNRR